jgi:type VI protein secretion system component VasF
MSGTTIRSAPNPGNWPDETDPAWWLNRLRVRAKLIAHREAHGEATEALREDIEAVARLAMEAGTPPDQVQEFFKFGTVLAALGVKDRP